VESGRSPQVEDRHRLLFPEIRVETGVVEGFVEALPGT